MGGLLSKMAIIPADIPGGYALVVAAVAIALYASYQLLLPKPIPGIPYNDKAARSILGDLPAMQRDCKDAPYTWMVSVGSKHPGPLFQFFLGPFDKPYVLITDYREAQDIMMRRKEFDRSRYSIDLLSGQVPNHHINLVTGPTWKAHRRLLQDLMGPAFLNHVAAPNIYQSALTITDLWKKKAQLANGSAFTAENDIYFAALDAVLDFGFGKSFPHRALPKQIQAIEATTSVSHSIKDEGTVEFPVAPIHETLASTMGIADAIGEVANMGIATLGWWYKNNQSSEKKAHRIREEYVKEQVLMAKDRLEKDQIKTDAEFRSAVDLMMHREKVLASKDGREPLFWSDTIRDEILGFVVAGHDTTSTTLLWTLKYLTDTPDAQKKLRDALYAEHSTARAEKRLPTHQEIANARSAYLEAFIEESLRLAHTIPIVERQCTEDTVVLGHFLPKGTTIMMPTGGPSITEKGRVIDESLRSESSQAAGKTRGLREWTGDNLQAFRPERWLENSSDSGNSGFDASAGPTLPFGLGLRGCFGRKLAYMELRLMVTLLVWNFEFLPAPPELSGYEAKDGLTHKPKDCYIRLAMPVA